jgi:hypothetical protein
MIQRKQLLLLCALLTAGNLSAQFEGRGQSDKSNPEYNPYAKALREENPVKRTWNFMRLFGKPELNLQQFETSPCNDNVTLSNARIHQFNDFVEAFIKGPKDDKKIKTDQQTVYKLVRNFTDEAQYAIKRLETMGAPTTGPEALLELDVCRAKGLLQQIKSVQAYLSAVQKVYPDAKGIEDVMATNETALQRFKDDKSVLLHVRNNRNAVIADISMPAAATSNAEWEKLFKEHFQKKYLGYTFIKQALTSADWFIKKNEISNHPEYRQTGTVIAAKAPDGKCKLITIDMYQYYQLGKYANIDFQKKDEKPILCEKL